MKAVIQRVKNACVTVDNDVKGSAEQGFLVLLGVEQGDDYADAEILAAFGGFFCKICMGRWEGADFLGKGIRSLSRKKLRKNFNLWQPSFAVDMGWRRNLQEQNLIRVL